MRRMLRSNVLRLILVVLVLLISLIPARYSNAVYAYLPSLTLAALVLLSLAGALIVRHRIRFDSDCADAECRRGDSVPMNVKVRNGSLLACPRACVHLFVSDPNGGGESITTSTFALAGRSAPAFDFDVRMSHIGEYRAGLRAMEVYDFLGLFRLRVPGSREVRVTVLPQISDLDDLELYEQMLTENHDQRRSVVSDGFNYNGVREYAIGDSMKRIHWKLSAHTFGYMTKITESSLRSDLTVVLDLSMPDHEKETLACLYDAVVETALSFIRKAASMDTEYSLIFPDRDGAVRRMIPKNQDDERELIHRMTGSAQIHGLDYADGAQLLQAERKTAGGSSNLIVCTAHVTGELLQELTAAKRQRREPLLCCLIPCGSDRRQRTELAGQLRALDESGVAYTVLTADRPEVD